jgi:predicted ester cyclase
VEPADAIDVVRSYLTSFATADPATIAAHVSDGFVNEHTSTLGSSSVGRSAYLERLPNFLADMVDLNYAIEDLVHDGDRVAAFYTMTAKWQGETAISIRGVQRLVVADGLITHRTDYWDSGTFVEQTS